MASALKLKWNCCGKFRQALMSTEGLTVAEATQDDFWGVGVAPNLAQQTQPSKFLGQNHLGRQLMSLRDSVAARDLENQNDEFQVHTNIPPMDTTVLSDGEGASELPSAVVLSTKSEDNNTVGSATQKHPMADPPQNDSTVESISARRPPSSVPARHPSTPPGSPNPSRPPRKHKNRQSDVKYINTMDKFVIKESPSIKRKLSSESTSPSSVQIAKTIRTDGGDDVS